MRNNEVPSFIELSTLVDDLNAGVYRNTPGHRGRFLYFNRALREMFGYSEAEMRNLLVCRLYPHEDERADFEKEVKAAGGFIKNKRIRLVNKRGEYVYGDITAKAVFDKSAKRVVYYNGIILDVTDQVEIYENISHQIITPLLAIRDNARKLLGGNPDPSKQRLLSNSILGCAKIGLFLTRNLKFMSTILGYSKETFIHQLEQQPLSRLIHAIVIDLQEYAKQEKGVNINIDSDSLDALPDVSLNKDAFLMVVFCLLDNAIKYSFENTTIHIFGRQSLRNVILSFQNDGIPIASTEVNLIFDKRYRGQLAQSFVPAGTGLGLHFSKRIMELHGGKIIVEPTKSYSTTFQLLFPRPGSRKHFAGSEANEQ
jgi:PAS domain S-box-containing protein